jgi:hypothetical protein
MIAKIFQNSFILIIVSSIVILFASCRQQTFQAVYPTLNDGRYDSEFPYRNCSSELDEISKTVKKLYCLVEYDQYSFKNTDLLTHSNLTGQNLKKKAVNKGFFTESVHGTATVIYNEDGNILVLTCAHVIDYPDTVFSYFLDEKGQKTQYIESLGIKKKQQNFIRDFPDQGLLEIIAMDKELDIAFLGNHFDSPMPDIRVFSYPTGDSRQLEWGSFVYIIGFPAGYQMVTRGIVSNPNPGKNDEFIIDALFNTGISGGIVLAVRDGVPNFELVGIAKSVSAKYKNVLRPEKESHEESYNPNIPYHGDLYVKMEKDINYGITFTVSIGAIRKFCEKNRNEFIRNGFNLDSFF